MKELSEVLFFKAQLAIYNKVTELCPLIVDAAVKKKLGS